jgi:hypothetical protein
MAYGFIFLLQNILNLLSYVHIKNCSIFQLDFGWTTFFVYFNLLTPKAMALKMFKTLTLMFTQSYVLNQS